VAPVQLLCCSHCQADTTADGAPQVPAGVGAGTVSARLMHGLHHHEALLCNTCHHLLAAPLTDAHLASYPTADGSAVSCKHSLCSCTIAYSLCSCGPAGSILQTQSCSVLVLLRGLQVPRLCPDRGHTAVAALDGQLCLQVGHGQQQQQPHQAHPAGGLFSCGPLQQCRRQHRLPTAPVRAVHANPAMSASHPRARVVPSSWGVSLHMCVFVSTEWGPG